MVKNFPSSAGDLGLIPGQGTKIPLAAGQINVCAATTKVHDCNKRSLFTAAREKPMCCNREEVIQPQHPATTPPHHPERSYPTSKVTVRSREDPLPEGRWPRGATPCRRSGAVAMRSSDVSELRGSSRDCQAATAQEQPRGATPSPTPGVAAWRNCPMPEARVCGQEK